MVKLARKDSYSLWFIRDSVTKTVFAWIRPQTAAFCMRIRARDRRAFGLVSGPPAPCMTRGDEGTTRTRRFQVYTCGVTDGAGEGVSIACVSREYRVSIGVKGEPGEIGLGVEGSIGMSIGVILMVLRAGGV